MSVATASSVAAERTLADRVLAAIPLLSIFLWLCIVYAIEAWAHGTPWLFGDELELTQLSRSIADTGHAARRGAPYSFTTLWTYVLAPAWLIDNLHAAYATVKYLTVIVMTSAGQRSVGKVDRAKVWGLIRKPFDIDDLVSSTIACADGKRPGKT